MKTFGEMMEERAATVKSLRVPEFKELYDRWVATLVEGLRANPDDPFVQQFASQMAYADRAMYEQLIALAMTQMLEADE